MIDDSANNEDGVCVDIGTRTDLDGSSEKEYWKSFKFGEVSFCHTLSTLLIDD